MTYRTLRFAIAVAVLAGTVGQVRAQSGRGVFVDALTQGFATVPLPEESLFQRAVEGIRARTRDSGPIVIRAARVARFASQQRCGRVAYLLAQPSSGSVFPQLGGQINICEDGLPPLRECADRPRALVPSDRRCKDGSMPRETAEVDAAIQSAIDHGSLKPAQAQKQWKAQLPGQPQSGAIK